MADWESQIAGERMAVDGEFSDRVTASSLSGQQWNLVMTAVSFEIENPGEPDEAELVADTAQLSTMMGDIERVGDATPGGSGGSSDDGILGGVLSSFGLGGNGGNSELESEANELAAEYAERLQEKLIERGRWEDVCAQAASG